MVPLNTTEGPARLAEGPFASVKLPFGAGPLPLWAQFTPFLNKNIKIILARASGLGSLLVLHAPGYLIRSRVLFRRRLLSQPAVVRLENNVNQTFRDAEFSSLRRFCVSASLRFTIGPTPR